MSKFMRVTSECKRAYFAMIMTRLHQFKVRNEYFVKFVSFSKYLETIKMN